MPGPIIIANAFLVTLDWSRYLGVQPRNVLGFTSTGDKVHVGTVVAASVTTSMFDNMEAGHILKSVTALPLDGASASYIAPVSGVAGAQTVNHIEPPLAGIVSMKTALRGPAHRGRVYVGPCSTQAILDGVILVGIVSAMQTAWNNFLARCVAATPPVVPVVVSRKHLTTAVIGQGVVEATAGTQRRRQTQLR